MNPAIVRMNILLLFAAVLLWALFVLSTRHARVFNWKGIPTALFVPFIIWGFIGWGRYDLWGEDFFSAARVISLLIAIATHICILIHAYRFSKRRGYLQPKPQKSL